MRFRAIVLAAITATLLSGPPSMGALPVNAATYRCSVQTVQIVPRSNESAGSWLIVASVMNRTGVGTPALKSGTLRASGALGPAATVTPRPPLAKGKFTMQWSNGWTDKGTAALLWRNRSYVVTGSSTFGQSFVAGYFALKLDDIGCGFVQTFVGGDIE